MDTQIIIVLILNFIIAIIGTLAYSVRLVAVRTGKIAVSFSIFNILTLLSRTAVTFQVPILTNHVEKSSSSSDLLFIFNIIILISGFATIVGIFLIPTFQKAFSKGVLYFSENKSIPKLIIRSCTKSGLKYMKDCIAIPVAENFSKLNLKSLPKKIIFFNIITVALITLGSLAPIYAGTLEPTLRATCITLSPVINGGATILMTIFIDPHLSIMTDDVIEGKCSKEDFKTCVIGMVASKTIGTFIALPFLIPASYLIAFVARLI